MCALPSSAARPERDPIGGLRALLARLTAFEWPTDQCPQTDHHPETPYVEYKEKEMAVGSDAEMNRLCRELAALANTSLAAGADDSESVLVFGVPDEKHRGHPWGLEQPGRERPALHALFDSDGRPQVALRIAFHDVYTWMPCLRFHRFLCGGMRFSAVVVRARLRGWPSALLPMVALRSQMATYPVRVVRNGTDACEHREESKDLPADRRPAAAALRALSVGHPLLWVRLEAAECEPPLPLILERTIDVSKAHDDIDAALAIQNQLATLQCAPPLLVCAGARASHLLARDNILQPGESTQQLAVGVICVGAAAGVAGSAFHLAGPLPPEWAGPRSRYRSDTAVVGGTLLSKTVAAALCRERIDVHPPVPTDDGCASRKGRVQYYRGARCDMETTGLAYPHSLMELAVKQCMQEFKTVTETGELRAYALVGAMGTGASTILYATANALRNLSQALVFERCGSLTRSGLDATRQCAKELQRPIVLVADSAEWEAHGGGEVRWGLWHGRRARPVHSSAEQPLCHSCAGTRSPSGLVHLEVCGSSSDPEGKRANGDICRHLQRCLRLLG
jgi:hypothetical protein